VQKIIGLFRSPLPVGFVKDCYIEQVSKIRPRYGTAFKWRSTMPDLLSWCRDWL